MLQNNEIINFLMAILLFGIFYFVIRKAHIHFPKRFLLSFVSYLLALVFTLIESYFMPEFFNFLEHLGYFFTALFFFLTIRKMKLGQTS